MARKHRSAVKRRRLTLESLETRRVLNGDARLVADLNTTYASSAVDVFPHELTVLENAVYFTTSNKRGLWSASAGNEGVEIVPPATLPSIREIAAINGKLVIADSQLWVSDGTAQGTRVLHTLRPGGLASNSRPQFTQVGNHLYFQATDEAHGTELWRTDGTAAGTQLVADMAAGPAGSTLDNLAAVGNRLFFNRSQESTGSELWVSNGTAAGTRIVQDIRPGTAGSNPSRAIDVNGVAYFVAIDDSNSQGLWKSNGTEQGTVKLTGTGIVAGATGVNVNGEFYFPAATPETGLELWRSDGTVAGTSPLAEVFAGPGSGVAGQLANVGGTLYFSAITAFNEFEFGLWKLAGTEPIAVTTPGNPAFEEFVPVNITPINGREFYFSTQYAGNNTPFGFSLWKSDGTTTGTVQVSSISGHRYSRGSEFNMVDGILYFAGAGRLYRTNRAGTEAEILSLGSANLGSSPHSFTSVENVTYFIANNFLWKRTTPTAAPERVSTNDGTLLPLNPGRPLAAANRLYIGTGNKLWAIENGIARPVSVPDGIGGILPQAVIGNVLYFTASINTLGNELWRTDGSEVGTFLVKDIGPGGSNSQPRDFHVHQGKLYFSANNGIDGRELWVSNGTADGTNLVAANSRSAHASIINFTSAGPWLYFQQDRRLFRTNGTAAGTTEIVTGNQSVGSLAAVNSLLYFLAGDGREKSELRSLSPSGEMTSIRSFNVNDIFRSDLENVNGTLFFTADGGNGAGRELWKSDGTEAGTQFVRDLNGLPTSSQPASLTNANGVLYFTADGETPGRLWRSDGTTSGTYRVPGEVSSVSGLSVVGDQLYFAGTSPRAGEEPFAVDLGEAISPGVFSLTRTDNGAITLLDTNFRDNQLRIERNGPNVVITETGTEPLRIEKTGLEAIDVQGRRIVIPFAFLQATGQPLVLRTGSGHDRVWVDTNGSTADPIPTAGLQIDLGGGGDTFDLLDNTTTNAWSLTGSQAAQVEVGSLGRVRLTGVDQVRGGAGRDRFTVRHVSPNEIAVINGEFNGEENEFVVQRDANMSLSNTQLTIPGNVLRSAQTFRLDNIQLARLTGGKSNNVLDARYFSGRAILAGGAGDDYLFGGSGNDELRGGEGNDWLFGNGGQDLLLGAAGRDILIGGLGRDRLEGGDGDDILHGGTYPEAVDPATAVNTLTLFRLLAIWKGPESYNARVDFLTVPETGRGPYLRPNVELFDENVADTLFGGAGLDWFFAETSGAGDETDVASVGVRDRSSSEILTDL